MQIKIHRMNKDVEMPKFETPGAVGFDLSASEEVIIEPGEIKLIPTGLIIEVPKGFVLLLASRSSTPRKKKLTMPHGIGVIDQDYCGPEDEIKIQMRNFSQETVTVHKGDRIAQGIFIHTTIADFVDSDKPANKTRGGFGSTG